MADITWLPQWNLGIRMVADKAGIDPATLVAKIQASSLDAETLATAFGNGTNSPGEDWRARDAAQQKILDAIKNVTNVNTAPTTAVSGSYGFDAAAAAQEAAGGTSGDPKTIWSDFLPKGDKELLVGGRAGTTPLQATGKTVGSSVFVEGGTATGGRLYDGGESGGPVVEKISDMLTYYSRLAQDDPDLFKSTQIKLLQAGAYGTDATVVPDFGTFGPKTRDALISELTSAAQNFAAGQLSSFDEYLDQQVQGQTEQAQAIEQSQPAPLVKNYWTDPNNVAAAAQAAAQQLLGKNLSDEQVQQFVNIFHSREAAFNQAAQQQSGEVNLTQPDVSSAAQQFVGENEGTDVAAHRMAGFVDQLRSMVGG